MKNKDLNLAINFLDKMELKGKGSLGRSKLKEVLLKKNEEVSKDQMSVVDEFDAWIDKEKGQFATNNKELNEAMNKLLLEDIELTYSSPFREDFITALENYEGDLSRENADAYATLYEELIEEKGDK